MSVERAAASLPHTMRLYLRAQRRGDPMRYWLGVLVRQMYSGESDFSMPGASRD
jgi:hypothetical protein